LIQSQDRVQVKTPEHISLQFQLAGLGSRTTAFIIDQLILAVINILLIILMLVVIIGEKNILGIASVSSVMFSAIIILLFIINWGYFVVLEFFSGGKTIGKRIVGIRVIQENGHSLTLLSSFIRNLFRIIDFLPVSYFLGIMMIFFHPKHKRLGDLVAGTIVVHERKEKSNKLSPIEKEIEQRGLSKEEIMIDEWTLQSIDQKDWNLIKTYSERLLQLEQVERDDLTQQVAQLIFPKLGWDLVGKTNHDVENALLVLYLNLREEWEYEL